MPNKYANKKRLRLGILVLGLVLALIGFEEVVDDVFHDPLHGDMESSQFDQAVSEKMQSLRTPLLTQAMTDLTALGSVSVMVTFFIILLSVLWSYREYKGFIYNAVVLLGAGAWPALLKPYFGRNRPEESIHLVNVTDLSFPSGHTFGAASVYVALSYYAGIRSQSWRQELFFYFLGCLIISVVAMSRIYLGVHYPTDVLGGLFSGLAWGLLASAVFEYRYLSHRRRVR